MAIVSKGPYYWDVRGGASARAKFTQTYRDQIPQGSTWLDTDGSHDLYIWNADAKSWELF